MYSIQNKHAIMMPSGVTAVSSPGANAQLTLGTFDANGVYPSGAAGMPLTLFGFAQSQYNTTASVTGVSGAHNNILTTNLDSTGFSAYSPITVTASAAFNSGDASVSIPSCSGIVAGMSVVDETSSLAGSPPYGSYFMGQAQGCVTGSPSTLSVGTGTATVTNGTANITWTGNGLGSNAEVMFNANVGSSFTSATPYYVVSTGDTIQLSATPSGSAITVSGLGTSPTTVSIFAQPSVGYTAASAAGTSLASTYAAILQGSVGSSDTLLIGGGVVVGGTDVQGDNFASAVVSSVITNAKACVFQLASPLRVYPGVGVTTTGGSPSGYNFTNKIVSSFVDSTGEQITVDIDCTSLGAITSSPTMTVAQGGAANSLHFYSRQTTGMQTVAADDISYFAANGGVGMAQYGFEAGVWNNDGVQPSLPSPWIVFNTPMSYPNSYIPSHAWNAYVSANGGTYTGNTYPFLLKRDLDPESNDNSPAFLNKAA